MTRRPTQSPTAEFCQVNAEIAAILVRLTQHSENHLGVEPFGLNWSRVTSARRMLAALKEISDMEFGEGEYAPAQEG